MRRLGSVAEETTLGRPIGPMLTAGKLQRVPMRFALRHPSERQLFNSRLQRLQLLNTHVNYWLAFHGVAFR